MAAPKKMPAKKAAAKKQDPIAIKPQNEGKLRKAAGAKKGEPIPVEKLEELKKSPDPKTRQRANFALNAKSWGKGK